MSNRRMVRTQIDHQSSEPTDGINWIESFHIITAGIDQLVANYGKIKMQSNARIADQSHLAKVEHLQIVGESWKFRHRAANLINRMD